MTKSDLKTGMRVKLKGGAVYIVLKEYDTSLYGHQTLVLVSKCGFMNGESYNEKLECTDDVSRFYDIDSIYACPGDSNIINHSMLGDLLWERKQVKEMTLKQIEDKLGYKVKIVETKP